MNIESSEKLIIGITHGDVNGIGYEVIIKTLMDPRILEMCTPVVYGSAKVGAYHKKTLNIENFSFNSIRSVDEALPKQANIITCIDDNIRVELGKPSQASGLAAFQALERASEDLETKKIDALITAPINKFNIQSDNFNYPGHTEYLAKKFSQNGDGLMLLVSESLRVGVVTGHIPITEISKHITKENILAKLRILNDSLMRDFRIVKPRIAVLGLNPHSGDNGLIGMEELDTIIPALNQARAENIIAMGPFPADGFFGSGGFAKFDAVLAMYHDQGLIPFKALTFDEGVNYTAGLSIIRTSPDHGTAYEIAGQDIASANSFRQALYMPCDIHVNRKLYKEIYANPLQKHEIED